jgi:NAD+ synthase
MNYKHFSLLEEHLVLFLKNEVSKTKIKKVVIGLSGGLDSAVVALLCLKAFGKNNLLSVLMPTSNSSKDSLTDAKELCRVFDINYEIVNITPFLEVYNNQQFSKNSDNLRIGNFSARIRMSILFDISNKIGAMVVGTSNKSELMLGYGTWHGDLASSLNPIGDIYKTQLFKFAKHQGVIEPILEKKPSADLWSGQSDEQEFGFTYKEIDNVLYDFVEKRANKKELIKKYDNKLVDMVLGRVFKNQFKRKPPIIAKVSNRTIAHDFLYARDIKT